MNFFRSLMFLFAFVFFSNCNQEKSKKADTASFNIKEVSKIIEKENAIYFERFLHNDTGYFFNKYTPDACIFPDDATRTCNMNDIANYYFRNGANKSLKIKISPTDIYGSDAAVVEEGEFAITTINGAVVSSGKFIAIWKNDKGKWKIHKEIWNTNKN